MEKINVEGYNCSNFHPYGYGIPGAHLGDGRGYGDGYGYGDIWGDGLGNPELPEITNIRTYGNGDANMSEV